MTRKVLFVAREGTLIEKPAEGRVDAPEKVLLMPGVIGALDRLQRAGYEIVIVTNQPGLGNESFRRPEFERTDAYMRALFSSQGITFATTLICPHDPEERCGCRKPGVGLVREFLTPGVLDRERSAVVGKGPEDLELAANIGIAGFVVEKGGPPDKTWSHIAHLLVDRPRTAVVKRKTRETDIRVEVDLDREADPVTHTGLGFFDHMLEQIGKHGGFALEIECRGDLHVDEHHTVEDVALALGEALRKALGDKRGIGRYGFLLPMDEASAEIAIDLGGRPYLVFEGTFAREQVGDLPTELVPHFFRSLAESLGANVHVRLRGDNAHHMIEAAFKGVARTLRQAIAKTGESLPSTKGKL